MSTLEASRQSLLVRYMQLDAVLVANGWFPTSPYFMGELLRFCRSCVPDHVIEVGRRGGKSTYITRLLVAQALDDELKIDHGDTGVIAVVSVSLAEAKNRLKTIQKILDVIGEPHQPTAEKIRLTRRPIEFKAFAASLSASVGFTGVAVALDEMASMKDDSGQNNAREIVEKISPAMTTIPSAFLLLSSSPDSANTYHHGRYLEGDNDRQIASNAPSWIANPSLSREETRIRCPDERVWRREYLAQASEFENAPTFQRESIVRALAESTDRGSPIGKRIVCLDPSSGTGGDAFVWAAAGWNQRADGTRVLSVDEANGQRGPFHTRIRPDEIVRSRVRSLTSVHGANEVFSDQHLAPLVDAECKRLRLFFQSFPFTHENKNDAVRKLVLMLDQGQLVLPAGNGWLRKELMSFTEKTTRTGRTKFEAKGKKHDDMVSCLLILMIADSKGLLEGGVAHRIRRNDPPPKAGGKLMAADMISYRPRDNEIRISPEGRAFVVDRKKNNSPLSGGGF